ncbi:spore germination gerac [Lucifera butyrica]|uniref:Spore germination gerac n=1 Tax=Lucifera butyrica TaxID=1351585 RepID=A0A498R8X4_9FIRM|nr:Ger(x)C family spore germination protein [Lucifera butyrica]VBB07397.1 spore germination gerac [Lucifera butyrica]
MKKLTVFFIVILIMSFTAGCFGANNEIEKLGIVVAMGIDITPDSKYSVSLQILKAQKKPSSGGMGRRKGGKQEIPTDVDFFTVSGDTIYDALGHLSTELGKKLHLAHIDFVVISEKAAKSGVASIIDAGLRSHQLRDNTPILVTKDKAAKIIYATTPEDPNPASAIKNILDLQSRYGYSPIVSYLDFSNSLSSKTVSPVAGVINLDADGVLKVAGTAVFNKDKLIGYMDEKETRGMQWLKGRVKDASIVIRSPDKGKITLRVTNASSKIKPILSNHKPVMQVTIKTEGYIRDMEGSLDPMKEPDIIKKLDEIESEAIKQEIDQALYTAQKKFKADIFEFGEIIHREYPEEWKSMEPNWNEIFPDLAIEITVDSHIRRPGMISKPLY